MREPISGPGSLLLSAVFSGDVLVGPETDVGDHGTVVRSIDAVYLLVAPRYDLAVCTPKCSIGAYMM